MRSKASKDLEMGTEPVAEANLTCWDRFGLAMSTCFLGCPVVGFFWSIGHGFALRELPSGLLQVPECYPDVVFIAVGMALAVACGCVCVAGLVRGFCSSEPAERSWSFKFRRQVGHIWFAFLAPTIVVRDASVGLFDFCSAG